jgi:hypothetical protein
VVALPLWQLPGLTACVALQEDDAVAPINILIVVVVGVFGQATEEEQAKCWSQQ